jgi:hypothetical protein
MNALAPNKTLGGGSIATKLPELVSWVVIGMDRFDVHYVEIEFFTESEEHIAAWA